MAEREDDGRHVPAHSPEDVGTQALPIVRQDGVDPHSVRAVARRVPSALPALGRDEVSDLPASARATADRRRRERETAEGGPSEAEPEPTPDATAMIPRQRGPESDAAPPREAERLPVSVAATPVAAAGSAGLLSVAGSGRPSEPPAGDVELVPIGSRSREIAAPPGQPLGRPGPIAPLASAQPPPPAGPTPGDEGGRHARHVAPAHETPYASGGETSPPPPPPPPPPPAPPVMGQPPEEPEPEAELEPGSGDEVEIVDGEIVEEQPPPFTAADVQTDEWATVPTPSPDAPPPGPLGAPPVPRGPAPHRPPQSPAGPRSAAPPGGPRPGPPPRQGPPPRPGPPPVGPGVLAADSWGETAPLPPVDDGYQGRRRRVLKRVGSRPSRAGWLVVLGVVLSLSAAVAVPFLISGVGASPEAGLDGSQSSASSPSPSGSPYGPSLVVNPAPDPTTPAPSAPPATTVAATSAPTTTAAQTTPPPPFSVTLQAESGTRSGCAVVRTVGGATVVDRLGEANDWVNCAAHGTVTFNNVSLDAGTYTITIYVVFGERANDDSQRYARLLIDPDGAGDIIEQPNTYPRTTTCCSNWTTPTFPVSAGTFDISFTHPGIAGQTDRAPALDRIVIQRV